MPTSEPLQADGDSGTADGEALYRAARAEFRRNHVTSAGRAAVVQAFDGVRNLPYFSGPDRSPLTALRTGRGACTAKHILLRDILRDLGWEAEVELVACDFARGLPVHDQMPADLRAAIRSAGIRDIHCWVRLKDGAGSLLLDATWPDAVAPYGFDTNRGWTGNCDTRPAVVDWVSQSMVADVLERKRLLLAELDAREARARAAFLKNLSAWLETLPEKI